MSNSTPFRFSTISDYHRVAGLPKPAHPLISVVRMENINLPIAEVPFSLVGDFYWISMKKMQHVKFRYGQQNSDFDEGVLFFMSPGQLFGVKSVEHATKKPEGWMILIHPDFLWNTALAKNIKQYEFFSYSVNEALYLSEKEETMLTAIAGQIEQEYNTAIDRFSQSVIIAQLELLLTYSERFYQRQFITRKKSSHELLTRLEDHLDSYFNSGTLAKQGLPSVTHIAEILNISPGYLSSLLKTLTGQTMQQHLHHKLVELAKEKLSTTNLTVSEIAYELGFEHLQSFSKLFKTKTSLSPLEFRQSFN
ncbi:helix-turn-helix transcriptional regulator [Mucilaginibacter rubeus]|uniref:Helix-turn-helix transcriptional regulator n=1 Tax=Mucilaginibacter rubeus TaxID=2027860 RepID=A0AAE6MGU4_9SPHI|nr:MULTISPECIES: helix-turn-helix transcriptional regulator [Mucilaginibacter]QEM02527.1 helix-turn-helix transcriptional regulator [Mucilaginibacter rubeus]QEM15147.1 helix-turn-helix transcriptional regulator [Mucilaginibacter gossypii]QTE42130.1 helix-turn-helix transcriptional regulator [Mucilaginibacter rubeus]QTE48731.1 helix-turn-helix transcriptional regulator [Mucilaginibacter rubeus]QTE53829.1 helix-turn-helix transcriptional regulator [Mucilaginibacter rubeus]